MTVDDCIDEYERLAGDIFGHPRPFHDMNTYGLVKRCKYNTKNFERIIKDVIIRRVERGMYNNEDARFDTAFGLSRVFVVANIHKSDGVVEDVRFFRSYEINSHREPRPQQTPFTRDIRHERGGRDISIWQVARATTAAPMFFRPLELMTDSNLKRARTMPLPRRRWTGNNGDVIPPHTQFEKLEDGGFGPANNPSKELFDELRRQLPDNKWIGIFVSIGTARPMEQPTGPRLFRVLKGVASRIGNPEPTHRGMEEAAKGNRPGDQPFSYYRLNQPNGLSGVAMDDWKPRPTGQGTRRQMQDAFAVAFGEPDMIRHMQDCARELVAARRARVAANEPKWKRFALGRYFLCRIEKCPDDVQQETEEDKFKIHLKKGHGMTNGQIDDALRRCEDIWTYREA